MRCAASAALGAVPGCNAVTRLTGRSTSKNVRITDSKDYTDGTEKAAPPASSSVESVHPCQSVIQTTHKHTEAGPIPEDWEAPTIFEVLCQLLNVHISISSRKMAEAGGRAFLPVRAVTALRSPCSVEGGHSFVSVTSSPVLFALCRSLTASTTARTLLPAPSTPGTIDITATSGDAVTTTHMVALPIKVPIAGLTAANDGPTELGSATAFRVTISAGTNVSYTWDFGDGVVGTGAQVTHVYAAVGTFTASVNARNSRGAATTLNHYLFTCIR
jgi:hypothetical protein